jgi:hypothetical protein
MLRKRRQYRKLAEIARLLAAIDGVAADRPRPARRTPRIVAR